MIRQTFQVMVNLKKFKILNSKQASFYQIRVSVYTKAKNKQKSELAVPFLIINQQNPKNSQTKNQNQFDNKDNIQPNCSQIDNQNNAFLSRKMLVRSIEKFVDLQEACIFKGQIYEQLQKNEQRRIYICCQLFQLNSFGEELVAQWIGYSLIKNGSTILPVYFSGYCSSCLITQVSIFTIQMSLIQENSKQLNQIFSTFNQNKDKKDKRKKLFFYLIDQTILSLSQIVKQILKRQNNSKLHQMIQQNLIQNQKLSKYLFKAIDPLLKGQKNIIKSVGQSEIDLQKLNADQFKNYLEKSLQQLANSIYELWKLYQNLSIRIQDKKFINQSVIKYQNQLDNYHQNHHIQKVNHLYLKEQAKNQQQKLIVNNDLFIYPFSEHQISLRISKDDMKKLRTVTCSERPQLIVFIHGYQASSYDMQYVSTFIKYKNPKVSILLSSVNEGRTQQKIEQSGHRLALQIKNHINSKCDVKDLQISFVCHSMGGLIARASLKYLQLYKNNFRTFLSFCSPHFGYLCHSSTLINTSIWVLNQIKKDQSMIQLTMKDNESLQKTYLFELSKRDQIKWFKHMIFLGSKQDQYVPFNSAIVASKQFYFQTYEAKIHNVLYQNFCKQIENKIIRLQAVYKQKVKDISSFVGRTAHIKILSSFEIIQLVWLMIKNTF